MLKFYYHPLSPIVRRVWIALLEKEIAFEPILVDLRGKQFKEDFLAISPFHHVPVVVHEGERILESLAILDYLEHRFPEVSLSPASPAALARMRMVQLVTTNELLPKLVSVANAEHRLLDESRLAHLETCFQFLEQQLGTHNFFGEESLDLADIVVGSTLPLFNRLGIPLEDYPLLLRWQERILEREAWVRSHPSDYDFQRWKCWIQLQVRRRLQKRSS
ncbi:MAG: glutathione S-transferase family protein [Cyanobacteria bacterium P01_F01_bin.53]